jgi:hypothetical protein
MVTRKCWCCSTLWVIFKMILPIFFFFLSVKKRWSIDPFGHSPVIPWALSQMGLSGIVINRVHQHTKQKFRNEKQLEFIWRQNFEHEGNKYVCDSFIFY